MTQFGRALVKLNIEIEAATIRYGVAVVDEGNSGLLLFRVNKAPSGALVTKVVSPYQSIVPAHLNVGSSGEGSTRCKMFVQSSIVPSAVPSSFSSLTVMPM